MQPEAAHAPEPTRWILVFNRTTTNPVVRWLAPGRYKHVSAYAWLPGLRAWLFYDVHFTGTSIAVMPDGTDALAWLYDMTKDADLLEMTCLPGPQRGRVPLTHRIGFWCVPAIRHLVGVRSGALSPSAFYRHCVAAGARPPDEGRTDLSAAAA